MPKSAATPTFTPLAPAEARKAVRWFQRQMGITDWRIKLLIADEPPPRFVKNADLQTIAMCSHSLEYKTGTVWVSNSRCKADGSCPMEKLFHEMMHLVAEDTGIQDHASFHKEFVWHRLGAVLATAYCAEQPNA